MKEYIAKDGYYYHKDNLYARGLVLPDSLSIDEFELVDEATYQEHLAAEKAKMAKSEEEITE